MTFPGRFLALITFTGCLAWFEGCFTEVGNAEDERLVTAEFKVDYSPAPYLLTKASGSNLLADSILFDQFYLLMHEASYMLKDSVTGDVRVKHLWAEDSISDSVDFTGNDSTARVSMEKIGTETPENLRFELKVAQHAAVNMANFDFATLKDKGFIKGVYGSRNSGIPFLFSLPSGSEIHINYSKATMLSWLKGDTYHCEIAFLPNKWLDTLDLSQAKTVRDISGRDIIILDANNNPALFRTLTDSFFRSFNSTGVSH